MKRGEAATVLIVDDEPTLRLSLSEALKDAGYRALAAPDGEECMRALDGGEVDVVLLDVMLRASGEDGQTLLKGIVREHPEALVIMMTALSDAPSVVNAMKSGAYDYLVKGDGDFVDRVQSAIGRALDDPVRERQVEIARVARTPPGTASPADRGFIAESSAMRELLDEVRLVARSAVSTTVLILGETGAGKEMVARELHYLGTTTDGPFLAVEPATVKDTLLESELFGHERGAFTDAKRMKRGLFELSAGGTLFLDEIGELSPALQVKLLRAIDTKRFRRLGGLEELSISGRVVAATLRDLEQLVEERRFREDLYFRLNVIALHVPPLRERPEDVLPIARDHLARAAATSGRPQLTLTPAAEAALLAYSWPGNVRELRNALERALVLADGPIELKHLPPKVAQGDARGGDIALEDAARKKGGVLTLAEGEQILIRTALAAAGGNKTLAAKKLGIARQTLRTKLRDYGIPD